jgi:hypothetical protein
MMLAYNLFLLFKIDMVRTTEYRQQINIFFWLGRSSNGKKYSIRALGQISISRVAWSKSVWMNRTSAHPNVFYLLSGEQEKPYRIFGLMRLIAE